MADIAELGLKVNTGEVQKGAKELKALGEQAKNTEKSAISMGKAIGGAVAALASGALFQSVIQNSIEASAATAQLEATLRSTGRYTPELSASMLEYSSSLQQLTTYGDEAITGAQSLLLTFKQVGDETFPRATEAILDMATAMKMDLQGATLMVGKALNDPVQGISALTRSGIQFTDSQKDMIKALVETGKAAEAQSIVLKELESQFGGSAAAARDTLGGALVSLQNAFGDLLEGDGDGVSDATRAINDLTKALSDPQIKAAFGVITAGVIDVATAVAQALPELLAFTRWAGEELASIGGIAGDDIVRLEDKAASLSNTLTKMQENGDTDYPAFRSMSDSLDAVNAQIDAYYKTLGSAPSSSSIGSPNVPAIISAPTTSEDGQKALEGMRQRLELAKLEGEAREKLAAIQALGNGATKEEKAEAEKLAVQIYNLQKAKEGAGVATKALTKDTTELASAQRSNEQVIVSLAEELYQASLSAEQLAQRQAQLQLNKYATPEQIESVRMLTAELYKQSEAERAREAMKAKAGEGVSDMPGGGALPFELGGVTGEQQRLILEAEQLALWRETELANQAAFLEAKAISEQEYAARVDSIRSQSDQRTTQINLASQQVQLAAAESLFASLTSMTATFAGEQSAAYKAMFLVQQAAGIAQSLVAINTGIAMAAANPFPLNLAAMATVAAATAGLVGNVAAVTASFDGGGFTGYGARSGGVDGKGGFMAIMHPNETVIDHTKGQQMPSAGRSGGQTVNNNFIVQGKPDQRTQSQIALKSAQAQRQANARFG